MRVEDFMPKILKLPACAVYCYSSHFDSSYSGAQTGAYNFTVCKVKPISQGHSLTMPELHTNICMAGAHTNRRKSPRIAPAPSADAVVWPRARRTHTRVPSKIAELPGKKAPPPADLRGSAGPPRVTHSIKNRKIKLRRLHDFPH